MLLYISIQEKTISNVPLSSDYSPTNYHYDKTQATNVAKKLGYQLYWSN